MHPRLAEIMEVNERAREELLACVGDVPADVHTLRPSEGSWSVVEVLGHLHLVEDSSVRLLFRAFRKARDDGLEQECETTSLLATLDHLHVTETRARLTAPDLTLPTDVPDLATVLARLANSRQGLWTWAREADGYALGNVQRRHPILGELSLYGWPLLIGQHELRHVAQIRDIVRRLGR
jgi:hypothetical protein